MRTEIFDPKNFQICIRTSKNKEKIAIYLLDLRLPAGTVVEVEETSTYGITPMYYADDCCITSPVYLARIIQDTLRYNYDVYDYGYDCHIYTTYTVLSNPEAELHQQRRGVRIHSGVIPPNWHRCNAYDKAGTGKTTAAKALGKALHEAGVISRGDVVYRDRSTLVGPHVGDSEACVRELFEKYAPGNVVVIDEAYTLTADSWKGDFGHRVVDSLMTYTADPKADYVVVLCGYREEMNRMLATNSGLSSRFSLRFDFKDFCLDELLEITHRCLHEMDYHFTSEAERAYSDLLQEILNSHQPHFGNARWVNSAIHQHILEALHRRQTQCLTRGAIQLSREFFTAIERADIMAVADELRHLNADVLAPRRIGFAA